MSVPVNRVALARSEALPLYLRQLTFVGMIGTSEKCRFCCKPPIMPFDQFPANRPNEPQSPIDVALRPLPKSPVSSSLDNVVPQSIVRSPRVRPGKFVFSDAKRLLQQYLPATDIAGGSVSCAVAYKSPHSPTSSILR